MTMADLRGADFGILVAIGADGKASAASGSFYVEDGVSINPGTSKNVSFECADGTLTANGSPNYEFKVKICTIRLLCVLNVPETIVGDDYRKFDS